jgi:hypothetical protein
MPRLSEIWIETWEPDGVVRADRIVRLHLRRGANAGLPEPGPDSDVREVSFCAEITTDGTPLLLGTTDDVAHAPERLAELVDTLDRAVREQVEGPLYVFRSENADAPWWTVGTRLPGGTGELRVPAPRPAEYARTGPAGR